MGVERYSVAAQLGSIFQHPHKDDSILVINRLRCQKKKLEKENGTYFLPE